MVQTLVERSRGDGATSSDDRRSSPAIRRIGYGLAVLLNLVGLYLAVHLVEWEWPRFITREWDDALPWVVASIVSSIVVNLVFMWRDDVPWKPLGDLVDAAFGIASAIRLLQVFPFDFSTYATNWSWVPRSVLIVTLIGVSIGALANLVKLARWALSGGGPPVTPSTPADGGARSPG